jgi:hypothetical protein
LRAIAKTNELPWALRTRIDETAIIDSTGIFWMEFLRRRRLNMMQMTDMPIVMMWGMGLIWLLVIIFLLLGIAAFIKYLRS